MLELDSSFHSVALVMQFQPFSSAVDAPFWHLLKEKKIQELKLDDRPIPIWCSFTSASHESVPARLSAGSFSFDSTGVSAPKNSVTIRGSLHNFNTFSDFKNFDRVKFLQNQVQTITDAIQSGDAIQHPEILNQFAVLSFADLKTHRFTYWFCMPSISIPNLSFSSSKPVQRLDSAYPSHAAALLSEIFKMFSSQPDIPSFFVVNLPTSDSTFQPRCWTIFDFCNRMEADFGSAAEFAIGLVDSSSESSKLGWPCRNLLALIHISPSLQRALRISSDRRIKIFSLRDMPLFASYANSKQLDGFNASKLRSLIFDISMQASAPSENGEAVGISGVGWERNAQGKLGPRQVDLSSVMDPLILAEDSVDLNLRLMKWRVMPDLDLQSVQQQRCLLLGAGTLGCVVARTLLSWGVRKITLVDSGKVSFSNPVRQWLYNFDDCLQGGQPKALAAAASLRKIFPGANTEGVELSIPMPGHAAAAAADQTNRLHNDYNALVELIDSHDIIFLLTDSRESRWLPTMLAQHRGKLTINTALGFDSYLVMRHGMQAGGDSRLSCYFCADVVAPIDSMTDRTLDQQCTVSRPGLAPIAGALAVELLASLCQHPLGACAPAPSEDSTSQAQRGCLGVVPHQIRGSLSTFSSRLLTGPAFDRCIACSAAIMDAFNSHGFEFVMRALVAPTYLEDLTGLTELKKAAEEYSVDWEEADD